MNDNIIDDSTIVLHTTELIKKDFHLEGIDNDHITEEELLDNLSNYLALMMEQNMDYLLSLMYRLDIDERKINYAISPTASDAPNVGLAKLIIQRQKQRVFTKKTIKPAAIHEEDEELNELLW